MAAGATLSGVAMTFKQGGGPTVVDHTMKWSIQPKADNEKYATNSTSGWKEVSVGAKEWTCSVRVLLHAGGAQPFGLGDNIAIQGHVDGGAADYYSGTATVVDLGDLEVDPNSAAPLGQDITLEGDSVLVANGTLLNV